MAHALVGLKTNMSVLGRALVNNVAKILIFPSLSRNFTVAPVHRLKEIIENRDGKTLTIEARKVSDENESQLVKGVATGACPLCSLGLEVKHTDVLILSQFLRPDGCVLPRRITGLCTVQQRRVQNMVAMAQKAGLMPNLAPSWSKKDPKRRFGPKKFNTYFDETTIHQKYRNVTYLE